MKKILLSVVLLLCGITMQLFAQVNGTAARPLVSTAAKPVYYYIENRSASAGFTGNVLLPRATTGVKLRHALKTTLNNDSAMWQLVNESGTVKLKNKLTGYYMSGSHTCASAGDVFEVNKYEGLTYYKIRSGRQSPTLAHTNNLCDRQTTEIDRLHWYFIVTPESQANYEELLDELTASYFTDFGTYGRSDNARKLNSLSFTAAQNTTLTINQQTVQNTSPVYFDKTTQVIEVVPGSNLSVSFNWTGTWMRNIAYVDWNNDKLFSTTDATERIGYNALAGSGSEMTKSITYTVPAGQALGDYRMRIMVDWFENHSSLNEAKWELNGNGGSVVDVILRVTNTPLPASPALSFGVSNLIVKGDAFTLTPPVGATVKYTTDDTDPATSPTAVTGTSVTANGNFKLRAISVKDGINSPELVRDIKVLNITLGNEYYIVFQRYNATLALQDMGDGVAMQTKTLSYGTATQLWAVSKGGSDGFYKLTSQAGNVVYWGGSNFTVSAAPATNAEVDMRFVTSPNTTFSGFEIQRKSSTGAGMNPIGGSAVDKNIGEWTLGDGGNVLKFMTTKDILLTAITNAQNLLANTTEGTAPGQYSAQSRTDLSAAITTAQTAYNNPSSVNDVTAKDALNAAINAYKATINKPMVSTTENTVWYYLYTTRFADGVVTSNGAGAKLNAQLYTASDLQLWKVVANGSGYALVNKATDEYLDADLGGTTPMATKTAMPAIALDFVASIENINEMLTIQGLEGTDFRLHTRTSGYAYDIYNFGKGTTDNVSFKFVPYVAPSLTNSYFTIGGTTGTWYNGNGTSQSVAFNGASVGTFEKSTVSGFSFGGEVTVNPKMTGSAKLYYKIDNADSFTEIALPATGTNNKHYGEATISITGLTAGNHTLTAYFQAGESYDNNSGANYVAAFTVTDLSTDVVNAKSGISISTANGKITALFEGSADVKLYSVSGQLIKSGIATSGFTTEASRGIYILQINGTAHKVVLK
jgi:hypothetical protein